MDAVARRAEVQRAYLAGEPPAFIAKRLKASRKSIQGIAARLRKAGVDLPRFPSRATGPRTVVGSVTVEVAKAIKSGKTAAEIAAARGCGLRSIELAVGRARKHGLLPPYTPRKPSTAVPLPGGSNHPHYSLARSNFKMGRDEAIAFALACDAHPQGRAGVLAGMRTEGAGPQRQRAPAQGKSSIDLRGEVRCLGDCGKLFRSPDRTRVRMCEPCRRYASGIPEGW